MVVVVAIMGMALGALYQAAGGATRNVAVDERMAYGVELARSVLANNAVVPLSGLSDSGETAGGYAWSVEAKPIELAEGSVMSPGSLQIIRVRVDWQDGNRTRKVELESVAAGMEAPQ